MWKLSLPLWQSEIENNIENRSVTKNRLLLPLVVSLGGNASKDPDLVWQTTVFLDQIIQETM